MSHENANAEVLHDKLSALLGPTAFLNLVKELTLVVEHEVEKKSGVAGFMIKSAFKVLNSIKPAMIEQSITDLLPDFIKAFNQIYLDFEKSPLAGDLVKYMTLHQKKIADALLAVTDDKANVGKHKLLIETYKKLRPLAQEQVANALPAIAKVFSALGL
jgi:hypothetical protein